MASIEMVEFPQEHGLTIVSEANMRMAHELLKFCKATIKDPQARLSVQDKGSVEARVAHRAEPGLTLQAVQRVDNLHHKAKKRKKVATGAGEIAPYSQLGLIDSDGLMFINVEHRILPYVNFEADPFTQHILEKFRTHLAA